MAKTDKILSVQPIVLKPDEKLIIRVLKKNVPQVEVKQLVEALDELMSGERKFLVLTDGGDLDYFVLMKDTKVEVENEAST